MTGKPRFEMSDWLPLWAFPGLFTLLLSIDRTVIFLLIWNGFFLRSTSQFETKILRNLTDFFAPKIIKKDGHLQKSDQTLSFQNDRTIFKEKFYWIILRQINGFRANLLPYSDEKQAFFTGRFWYKTIHNLLRGKLKHCNLSTIPKKDAQTQAP